MISIGNDIVDLSAIDKQRTQQKAFYSKILSDTEQQLYSRLSQMPFEIFVWLLWSAKESVYKFAKRLNPELVFSPARIEVLSEPEFLEFNNFQNIVLEGIRLEPPSLKFGKFLNSENSDSGKISAYNYQINYQADTYYLRSLVCPQFIATLASGSPDFAKTTWGIKYIDQTDYETQSAVVRQFAISRLEESLSVKGLQINKNPAGYPVILNGSGQLNIPLSFAHHGHYVAYTFGG